MKVWAEWIALTALCGGVAWTGGWLARRYSSKAIFLALPLAAVGGGIQAFFTRPPRELWASRHSFEIAYANHFFPPALAFLAALWIGVAFERAGLSRWVAILVGAFAAILIEVVAAFAMML